MVIREDNRYTNLSSSSNIVYWSKDTWSKFIKDQIIPLHTHAQKLIDFYSYLYNFDKKPMSKVLKEWSGAEKALLGGVEFDQNNYKASYSERSLAKIYNELLGFYVDINAYFSYIVQGLEPTLPCTTREEESKQISSYPYTVTKLTLIPYIKNIYKLTSQIINLAISSNLIEQYESNTKIDDLIAEPERIVDDLYEFFFEKCISITLGHNDYMNFVWSIRKITRKYLYLLYPELRDEDKLKIVKEILGLNTLFKPQVEDEKLKEDYEILAFLDFESTRYDKEGQNPSLGGLLCKLNLYIWEIFRYPYLINKLITGPVPNLAKEYFKWVDEELSIKWSPPEIVKRVTNRRYTTIRNSSWPDEEYAYFYISGPIIESVSVHFHLPPSLKWKKPDSELITLNIPLFIVLDGLMPAVCLGKYEIVFHSSSDSKSFYIYDNSIDWG